MSNMPSQITNRYRITDELGSGSMGVVYKVYDRLLERNVALKVVKNGDFISDSTKKDTNPLLAITREFQILASLRHPNVIDVLDYGMSDNNSPFYTMRLLDDPQTIKQATLNKGVVGIVQFIIEILQALAYLHRRNIIHRDLKPNNILVSRQVVKVLDFGLAMKPGESDEIAGTLQYMSPEIIRSGTLSKVSDLYSVGVIAYELLAGKYPYDRSNYQTLILSIINSDIDIVELQNNLSSVSLNTVNIDKICAIISKLVRKNPNDRYQNASDVIWELSEAINAPADVQPREIRESFLQAAEFVGRETELIQLDSALDDLHYNKGSSWLIGGESGIGKTRLIEELRVRALVSGYTVLYGQTHDVQKQPFELWQVPLKHLLLSTDVKEDEIAILEEFIPSIDPSTNKKLNHVMTPDENSFSKNLSIAIQSIFQRQDHPLLLILEDLHWLTDSIDLLSNLAQNITNLPIMIVGTIRTDENSNVLDQLSTWNKLILERFDNQQIHQLAHNMLGDQSHLPDIVDFLSHQTEGNAFFMVEVMRILAQESKQLSNIGSTTLPSNIFARGLQEVVLRRLERVSPPYFELLKFAAISGRQLDLTVLEHIQTQILKSEISINDWLAHCENLSIIDVKDDTWQFVHDKLREGVLLEAQSNLDYLHDIIAQSIEAIYPDDSTWYATLAYHYRHTNHTLKITKYCLLAGRQSFSLGNLNTSRQFLTRAYNLSRNLDNRLSLRVKVALSRTIQQLGEELLTHQILDEAQDLSNKLSIHDYDKEIFNIRGDIELFCSHYLKAKEAYQNVITSSSPFNAQTAYAYMGIGKVDFNQNNYKLSIKNCDRSLAFYQDHHFPSQYSTSLTNKGNALFYLGKLDDAFEIHKQAENIAQQAGDMVSWSRACLNKINILIARQEYSTAVSSLADILNVQKKIGDHRGMVNTYINLATCMNQLGHPQIAMEHLEQSLSLIQTTNLKISQATILINMGNICMLSGQYDKSDRFFAESFDYCVQCGNKLDKANTLNNMGRLEFLRGNFQKSISRYEESLNIKRDIENKIGQLYSLKDRGFSYIQLSMYDEALSDFHQVLSVTQHEEKSLQLPVEALLGIASIYYHKGSVDIAYGILATIRNHQSFEIFTKRIHYPRLLGLIFPDADITDAENKLQRTTNTHSIREWRAIVLNGIETNE